LPATTTSHTYTLSLHDALPISLVRLQNVEPQHGHRTGETRIRRGHRERAGLGPDHADTHHRGRGLVVPHRAPRPADPALDRAARDRKSTRLNSSHRTISYAVFC